MKMNKIEKIVLCFSSILALFLFSPVSADAMHIMEGYLPFWHSVSWGMVCIPFLVLGFIRLRKMTAENRRALILLAMSGAFVFVISSFKIPSVTGSSSHMAGTGLSAILFGVGITSVLAVIVLLFQAVLLAHGGITTLGANTFSVGIFGPLFTVILYKTGKKFKINQSLNIFIAAALGGLFTYCITALQLAIAYPSDTGGVVASLFQFLAVFALPQIPLAFTEGLLTVLIIIGMESFAKKELKTISYMEGR